jgi:hypothetical protein
MKALAESQLIEDWEMHTRLGIRRETLREIVSRWPNIDDTDPHSDEFLAINNCMNEICNGLRISPEEWNKLFTLTRPQILDAYQKWSGCGGNYFAGLR